MMVTNQKSLRQYLHATPWRQLLAIMGTYHFSTSTRQAKQTVIQHLHEHLTATESLTAIVAQLTPNAKDALHHLLAADGALPLHPFEERYGPIRPIQPFSFDGETIHPPVFSCHSSR